MSAPAPLRDALLTDERLFNLATWAPFVMVALVILAMCWWERDHPASGEGEAEPVFAPPTAPSIDALRRDAGRH